MNREEVELTVGEKKIKLHTQHLPTLLAVGIVIGYSIYIVEFKINEVRMRQEETMRQLIILEELSRKNAQVTEQTYMLLKQWTSPGMWR